MIKARALTSLAESISHYGPGTMIACLIAMASHWLSDHYGAPAMLMALLLGIAVHFLSEETKCSAGINFCAKKVLRFGVAMLGARVSVALITALGGDLIALVVVGVIATIGFGIVGARLAKHDWHFGLLTGGSVAICGASAAMAIAATLPKTKDSERNLIFTVISVTILSTIAMIVYPLIASLFNFDSHTAGVFLGGTIHDVAQVVGAGFSIDTVAGETSTLVKMIRVTMLAPVVFVIAIILRIMASKKDKTDETNLGDSPGERPPLIPLFVLSFLILAIINSLGFIPDNISLLLLDTSKGALLVAMSAVGMKTSIKALLDVGGTAITLLVIETLFIGVFVTGGIILIQ